MNKLSANIVPSDGIAVKFDAAAWVERPCTWGGYAPLDLQGVSRRAYEAICVVAERLFESQASDIDQTVIDFIQVSVAKELRSRERRARRSQHEKHAKITPMPYDIAVYRHRIDPSPPSDSLFDTHTHEDWR